jgi:hypothetical protein
MVDRRGSGHPGGGGSDTGKAEDRDAQQRLAAGSYKLTAERNRRPLSSDRLHGYIPGVWSRRTTCDWSAGTTGEGAFSQLLQGPMSAEAVVGINESMPPTSARISRQTFIVFLSRNRLLKPDCG